MCSFLKVTDGSDILKNAAYSCKANVKAVCQ